MRRPDRSIRHLRRYREIAEVFIRHGFNEIAETLDIQTYLSLPRRLLRKEEMPPQPARGAPVHLRLALEELGATFIKLGQVLSTRPDLLPPQFVNELSKLQDAVPPADWDAIRAVIEEELGAPPATLFASFDEVPLAAASLSQVHAATLDDGSEIVLKIQRPTIQKTVEVDLEILFDLAGLLQERTPLGEIYDLVGVTEEFAYTLRSELDFFREGVNAERFDENFSDEKYLYVPSVYWDFTTRRVLALERIRGIKINQIDALDAAGHNRHRIAVRATNMIVKEVLEEGFFHADPHPGNFIVMADGAIGAMDFGMVGHLTQQARNELIRLYVYVIQLDEEGIVDQLIRMGATRSDQLDRTDLQRDIGRLIRKYHGMPVKAIHASEVLDEVMPLAFRHHLQLPTQYWLLTKTLSMAEGVALELDPDFDFFAISKPHVRRYMVKMALPTTWGFPLVKDLNNWADLISRLPVVGTRLLERADEGRLEIKIALQGLGRTISKLDALANRLSISLLLASLIIGLALLISSLGPDWEWTLTSVLIITGFVGCSLLGLWLIFSIWRSGRSK